MTRKATYNRTGIINAAIEVIEKHGKKSFSVRNVAKHMNSSTQPIYSFFSDSQELYQEALLEIKKRLLAYTRIEYSDYPFRNMGFGFTLFARDYPNLFRTFFDNSDFNIQFVNEFLDDLRAALDTDERFDQLSSQGKDLLLEKMWTFSFGYAYLIINGLVKDTSDEAVKKMILDVGTIVIKDALQKEGLI